jgi:hypothetical protein
MSNGDVAGATGPAGRRGMAGPAGPAGAPGATGLTGATGEMPNIKLLMNATEAAVKKLTRPTRRLVRILSVLVAILIVNIAVLGVVAVRGQALTNTVRAGAISSCEAGNVRNAADVAHWDLFINILLKGQTNKTAIAEGHEVEASVAKSDAPRDCAAIYHVPATTPAGK